jgi:hypothetical protein
LFNASEGVIFNVFKLHGSDKKKIEDINKKKAIVDPDFMLELLHADFYLDHMILDRMDMIKNCIFLHQILSRQF